MKNDSHVFLIALAIFLVGGGVAGFIIYNNKVSVETGISQASVAFDANNVDEAILQAEATLKIDKNNIDGKILLATAYAQKGSIEFKEQEYGNLALSLMNEVLATDPQNAEAYRIKGYAYEIMQNYQDANRAYTMSLSLDGGKAITYSNRAHSYELQGLYAEAERDYMKALSIDGVLDHALLNLSKIQLRNGKVEEAKKGLSMLIKTTLNIRIKSEGNQLLGALSLQMNDFANAKTYFNEAINLDNKLAVAYVGRAQAEFGLIAKDGTPEATNKAINAIFADIEKSTALNSNQTSAYLFGGIMLAFVGEKDAATEVLQEGLSVVKNDITLTAPEKTKIKAELEKQLAELKK